MSRAHNVVNKLQGLIDKSNDCTKKHDTNLHGAIDSLIEGFGKGEGGSGIIDVTELPTENIDENAIYRITPKAPEVYARRDSISYPFKVVLSMMGAPASVEVTIEEIEILADNILPSSDLSLHIYIVKNEGVAYLLFPGEEDDALITVGEFIGGFEDKGWTEDIDSETENGIYCAHIIDIDKITHYLYKDGNWVELISEEYMPIIKPLTITNNGVYEATRFNYDTEVKFKDLITETDFKAYIANARISGDDGERIFYVIADSIAVMQAEIPDSPSIYMIVDDFSNIGYVLNGAAWDLSDGWQNLDSGEPADAPIITIPWEAYMSADLDTTAVFFDVEKIDAYCPIIVDVAASAPPVLGILNVTKNGTYTAETVAPGGEYAFKDSYTEDELITLYENGAPDWGAESTYINSSSRLIDANFNLSIRNINNVHFIEYYAYDDSFGFVYATEEAAASGEIEQITESGWFDRNDMVKVDTPSIAFPSDTYFIVDLYMLTSMFKPTDGWDTVTVAVWPVVRDITIRKNGVYTPEMDVNGFSKVTVDVEPTVSTITITKNGVYTPSADIDGYSEIVVDVIGGGEADKYFEGGHTNIILPTATKIRNGAFQSDTALQNIEMPNVTNIGSQVFYKCSNLLTVEMPSVISIGSQAFYNCNNLVLTELPNGLTSTGNSAFSGCSKLALTELPSGLTSIDTSAFYGCSNLALTELPKGLTSISSSAFSDCLNLALTELPSGVTSISSSAFYNCKKLALTKLPEGLISIGTSAFRECSNLTLTELPDGLTSIDAAAFQNCSGLTTLTFKGTPTSIGSTAFKYCSNLKTINVPWAEGAVANAPWGATNATINYNYTGEAAE